MKIKKKKEESDVKAKKVAKKVGKGLMQAMDIVAESKRRQTRVGLVKDAYDAATVKKRR